MERIAFVSETWHPEINGVAHTLSHLCDQLIARGCELQLIRPATRDGSLEPRVQQELQVRGFRLPGYDTVQVGVPAPQRLMRMWREHRPSVVYIATEGPLGISALMVARRLGLPVVAGFHTNFDQYSTHYRLKALRPLVRRGLRRFHNAANMTLVPTRTQADSLMQQGFEHVQVVGRGLDCERFSPSHRSEVLRKSWGVSSQQPVALHVGRLAAEKNIELLIRTYEAMLAVQPDLALVLVGDGPLRERLEQRLPEAIFAGFQTGEALAAHYASADLFVFPSLSETFGNVVLEAMASGLAVIAFDYAAAAEVIRDDHQGLLAPCSQPERFIEQAVEACQRPARIARLGRAARVRVEPLGWSRIAEGFLTCLRHAEEKPDARSQPSRL
ncbi:glycosyltransferase family 4 protein [Cobetia amphilecti]|uniref:glycosyltransferase family 4 protein n=1 Tax=Cobetia amphilecti TaxID=1055104 RepID=UPI00244949B7|nr:glycosyltransferase family 1 protein [Cobetia litoralis]MDH2420445.1 glycosyltransferase family 1 protein [Cobetia litoralis]